jgi:CHAT domain-containing protein
VLLRYADTELKDGKSLVAALKGALGRGGPVEVRWWSQGRQQEGRVAPGPLGIGLDARPAAEAVRSYQEADRALVRARRAGHKPLPGTRREVQAIAGLFGKAEVLLGKEANEQRLAELAQKGALKGYRYLHLATHGLADADVPLRSSLALSDRGLPDPLGGGPAGEPVWTGRLTAQQIVDGWALEADVVVLSACQTGLGRYELGEGYLGFAQALFLAGARSVVLSQWNVDDDATSLLMLRFYQNLLGKGPGKRPPMNKAEALREAKEWLRNLSAKEVKVAVERLPRGKSDKPVPLRKEAKPFAHPYYWAAFVLIGDPR